MKKEAAIIPEGIKPFKSKYGLSVFLVCLFFSVFLWLVIKFSKEYEIRQEVHITYINVPEGKLIVQADTIIHFTIKANGFSLITEKTDKPHQLTIDISNFPLQAASAQRHSIKINSTFLTPKILDFYRHDYTPYDLTPVEARVFMEAAYSKKVPVKKQFTYSTEQPYAVYGAFEIRPDSVMVYGSRQIIEMINEAPTIDTSFGTLSKSILLNIPLLNPNVRSAYFSQKHVEVSIPVEKFTEKELTIAISPIELPDGRYLKMFPENVQLTFLTALKDYNDIIPALFEITVDTANMRTSNMLPLYVVSAPSRVIVQKLHPERVEFIMLQ